MRSFKEFTAPYVYEILLEISRGPKRFVDLRRACPNEKTRSRRLKELLRKGLIKAILIENSKNRPRVHYVLTEKGNKVLIALNMLAELSSLVEDK